MGLFDIFLSEEKRIQKQQRRVTNRDLQPEDREAAARWLADNGSGKALMALLSRFEMRLENQMKDQSEREFVYGLLVQHGNDLARPLRHHLRKARQIAMPVRLLQELEGEEAAIEVVYDLLRLEAERDDFKPDKKTDLLVWLTDRPHPGAMEAAVPHLRDFDEAVRYAAAEVILAQMDDAGRVHLQAVLENPEEESNRLKVRLCDVFQTRRWTVDDPDAVAANLPGGYGLVDGRIVANG